MFFILSKVLSFLLKPLVWVFLLAIISLLPKLKNYRKKLIWSSFIVLFIGTNSFICDEFIRFYQYPITLKEDLEEKYDAALVMGGFMSFDPTYDRINWKSGVDRISYAVDLYHAGKVNKILVMGGSGSIEYPELKEACLIRDYLYIRGVKERDYLYECKSQNSYQNVLYGEPIMKENNLQKNILITSSMHMRRSLSIFHKFNLYPTPYAVDRFVGDRKFTLDHLLIPDYKALEKWESLFHEILGIAVYKLKGYI